MPTITDMRSDARDNGFLNANAWADSILEMVAALDAATEADADGAMDEARDRITESVLSVEVRTSWHAVGADDIKPTHYRILLTFGGPSLQLTGELNEHGEPETARLEFQDWETPWTEYRGHENHEGFNDALLAFASCFYFGE